MGTIALLLIVAALFLAGYGMTLPGTPGLAAIAVACLCGILARIAQAEGHQSGLLGRLETPRPAGAAYPSDIAPVIEDTDTRKSILFGDLPRYEAEGWRLEKRIGATAVIVRDAVPCH